VLAGCSSGQKESAQPPSTPNSHTASASCAVRVTTGLKTMDFGGVMRSYQLSLPKSYDGRTPAPVILNLHGLTSNIQEQDIVSNFPAFGGARG
jgi:polyhydroxybutyrate depolymerase